ncbi:MAG: ribonuclease HI [Treponema sp.]|jgi:ribonuclease HI|nr:ribonuclease HI [Treponema sp.]
MDIHIYTDGGCSGNPGPGGWAYLIIRRHGAKDSNAEILVEKWGAERDTTNNRMELKAVIAALKMLHRRNIKPTIVHIFTDSQYVQKGMTTWLPVWQENNWRTSDRKPVKNQELWTALDEAASRFKIDWQWVKGHDGNTFNERCDELTQRAVASLG